LSSGWYQYLGAIAVFLAPVDGGGKANSPGELRPVRDSEV
jgi:hypothetical protein